MKTTIFLLTFLLSLGQVAYAQLPNDSLKAICLKDFRRMHALDEVRWPSTYREGRTTDTVKELFGGYFNDMKLYTVQHCTLAFVDTSGHELIIDDLGGCSSMLYILDAYTGRQFGKKAYASFNRIMNAAGKKVINLDKCYLFLFINGMETGKYGLTPPDQFSHTLSSGSIFLEHERTVFEGFGSGVRPVVSSFYNLARMQLADAIIHSTNQQIYMYRYKPSGSDNTQLVDTAYGYRFIFDKDTLQSIVPLKFK